MSYKNRGLAARQLALFIVMLVNGMTVFADARGVDSGITSTPAMDLKAVSDLDAVIAELADKRVVFVGEQHDRYEHHLTQLEIIRRLHEADSRLAIGMEAFQQPFQRYLDDYIEGRLSEQEMLRATEYYARWRFDFRLYAPILRYAREHRLPVLALNLPEELTRKVGAEGIAGLSEEERRRIPAEIDRSDHAYEQRLTDIFDLHPRHNGQSFERFLDVQLLWDEGMAERAAGFLGSHPDYRLVILAGAGHLAYGSGIPQRLERRLPVSSAIVLNGWQQSIEPTLADFLLFPEERSLPAAGRLGAVLDVGEDQVRIASCEPGSACEAAGMKKGDQLVSINDHSITGMPDVRLALWDKQPGDTVTVEIRRKRFLLQPKLSSFEAELKESR